MDTGAFGSISPGRRGACSIAALTTVCAVLMCGQALAAIPPDAAVTQGEQAGARIFLKPAKAGATEISGLIDPPHAVVRRVTIEVRVRQKQDETCRAPGDLLERVVATTIDADRGSFKVALPAGLKGDVCVIATAQSEDGARTAITGAIVIPAATEPKAPGPPSVRGPLRAGMRAISGDLKLDAAQRAKLTRITATVWRSRDEHNGLAPRTLDVGPANNDEQVKIKNATVQRQANLEANRQEAAVNRAVSSKPAAPAGSASPATPSERENSDRLENPEKAENPESPESPRYVMSASTTELDPTGAFNVVMPQAVLAGQYVVIAAIAGDETLSSGWTIVEDPGDWGRIRAYFAGGVILSHEREEFSAQDFVLALVLDNAWYQPTPPALIDETMDQACRTEARYALAGRRGPADAAVLYQRPEQVPDEAVRQYRRDLPKINSCWKSRWKSRLQVNSFLDVRMTALPVQATAAPADPAEPKAAATASEAADESFVIARKAALIQVGVYAPLYGRFTMWRYQGHANALFVAPVFRTGIQTISRGENAVNLSGEEDDNVYRFWSAGFGIGHYKLSDSKDRAPELISYLHVTRGRFENFRRIGDAPSFNPLRWAVEGRLKIPETPMQIGLDANLGRGPDSVAFTFATRFDIGELLGKLKVFQP